MSTPETAMAERMYPSMQPSAQPAPAAAPRENIGIRLQAGDNSPAVELQPNKGMRLQAGDTSTETADAPTTPITKPSDAVNSTVSSAPVITEEVIKTAIDSKDPAAIAAIETTIAAAIETGRSPEIKAARAAEPRPYMNSLVETMGPATLPGQAAIHTEIAHICADVGIAPDDLRGMVQMAHRYSVKAPDEQTTATWRGLVTDQERQLAAQVMQADARIPALLKVWNLTDSPQILRALARSAQRRR